MKYAFLLGSNVFIVPSNTVSFTDDNETKQFLRIVSTNHDTPPDQPRSVLTIDTDIKDGEGHALRLTANKTDGATDFDILEQTDRVLITGADGITVLDVHQLDDRAASHLEHNILAELEVHAPVAVIRLRGNFMVGSLHIEIDNEKLFIGSDSYGNSALAGKDDLKFSNAGVLL
ncbi:MAG: hypothetical protein ACTHJ8_00295 [Mucilaginibacter sp.]